MTTILIGYDGSANAHQAIRSAAEVFPGAEAIVLTAWEAVTQVSTAGTLPGLRGLLVAGREKLNREAEEHAAEAAAQGSELAGGAGLRAEAVSRRADRAWDAILELADERDVGVIVVGRHGASGLERWLLGSVSSIVLQRSRRPVLVVPLSSTAP